MMFLNFCTYQVIFTYEIVTAMAECTECKQPLGRKNAAIMRNDHKAPPLADRLLIIDNCQKTESQFSLSVCSLEGRVDAIWWPCL